MLNEIVRRNHKLKVGEKAECQTNSFAKALTQAQRLVKHDGLVILISDGYGYRDNSEEQIKTLCQRNDLILCHVTDPLEHQLAGLDSMIVSDGQLQVAVSAKDKLRDDFNQDVVRAIERSKRWLRNIECQCCRSIPWRAATYSSEERLAQTRSQICH